MVVDLLWIAAAALCLGFLAYGAFLCAWLRFSEQRSESGAVAQAEEQPHIAQP